MPKRGYKIVFLLLLVLSLTMTVQGEDMIYYTTYEQNSEEYCHGLHVGDIYYYESNIGQEEVYGNGTVNVSSRDIPYKFVVEILTVPEGPIDPQEANGYSFNFTQAYQTLDSTTSKESRSFSPIFFDESFYSIFMDWNAWENLFNNITLETINKLSGRSNDFYQYHTVHNLDETFVYTNLYNYGDSYVTNSYNYNKSDGSLITYFHNSVTNFVSPESVEGLTVWYLWTRTHLVSKEKVSNEITCLELLDLKVSKNDKSIFLINPLLVSLVIIFVLLKKKNFTLER